MEVSPYNPDARRAEGGCWNEHVLPVLDWEIAEQRVVLPADLQAVMEIGTPVLRWDKEKYQAVINRHSRDVPVVEEISRYLSNWAYCGEETGAYLGNHRVLFQDDTGRWYAASMGKIQGSYNMITVFGSSKPNFHVNRLTTLRNVVVRVK